MVQMYVSDPSFLRKSNVKINPVAENNAEDLDHSFNFSLQTSVPQVVRVYEQVNV